MLEELADICTDALSWYFSYLEELTASQIIAILVIGTVVLLLGLLGKVIGYVLHGIAVGRIAGQQGARRRIVVFSYLPFVRYFAVGKVAERCDARRGMQVKSKSLAITIVCSIIKPVVLVTYAVSLLLVLAPQVAYLLIALTDKISSDFVLVQLILVALVFWLIVLAMVLEDIFFILMVLVPVSGMILAFVAAAISLIPLCILYRCYWKMLREYFSTPWAVILTVLSVMFGAFPVSLLLASLKKPLPAAAFAE